MSLALQAELNRLANFGIYREPGECVGESLAANQWAETSGLALVGALNVKAGTTGMALQGVLNILAGRTDPTTWIGVEGAAAECTAAGQSADTNLASPVAAVAAVGVPTVQVGVKVMPAVVAAVATVGNAAAQTSSATTVGTTVVAATAAVGVPVVATDWLVTPAVVAATAAVGVPADIITPIGYRGGAVANNGQTSTGLAINFTIPAAAQVGDLAIASMVQNVTTDTVTPPAGWTLLTPANLEGSTAVEMFAYYKILTAGEPGGAANFSISGSGRNPGIMDVFSGVDRVTPFDVTITTANSGSLITTVPAPAITSVTNLCQIYNVWGGNDATTTAETITVPGTHTAASGSFTAFAAGANTGIRGGYRTTQSNAGTFGAYNATFGTSARTCQYSVALRPA